MGVGRRDQRWLHDAGRHRRGLRSNRRIGHRGNAIERGSRRRLRRRSWSRRCRGVDGWRVRNQRCKAAPADPRASVVRTERAAPPPAPKVRSAATATASCRARPTAAGRTSCDACPAPTIEHVELWCNPAQVPARCDVRCAPGYMPDNGRCVPEGTAGTGGTGSTGGSGGTARWRRGRHRWHGWHHRERRHGRVGRSLQSEHLPELPLARRQVSPAVRSAASAAAGIRWWALSTAFDVFRNRGGVSLVGSRRRWRSCLGVASVGSL